MDSAKALDGKLRALHVDGHWSDAEFRQFACRCCRRVTIVFDHPTVQNTLGFAERRANAAVVPDDLESVRRKFVKLYDSMYTGAGAPSAEVLAVAAVGEAAFTEDALKCAIEAAFFVARAIATQEGDRDVAHFDELYDVAYERECAVILADCERG